MEKFIKTTSIVLLFVAFLTTSIHADENIEISKTEVSSDGLVIHIYGKNFTSDLNVLLDDTKLKILECSDTDIKASLKKNIAPGTYQLVLTGHEEKENPFIDVTIGGPELEKPKKPKEAIDGENPDGDEEPDGIKEDKKDKEGKKPE